MGSAVLALLLILPTPVFATTPVATRVRAPYDCPYLLERFSELTGKKPGDVSLILNRNRRADGTFEPRERLVLYVNVLVEEEGVSRIVRREAGHLVYESHDDRAIHLVMIQTEPDFQRMGIAKNLLRFIPERYPNAVSIHGELAIDNEAAFLAAEGDETERFFKTPSGKALKELGFGRLDRIGGPCPLPPSFGSCVPFRVLRR